MLYLFSNRLGVARMVARDGSSARRPGGSSQWRAEDVGQQGGTAAAVGWVSVMRYCEAVSADTMASKQSGDAMRLDGRGVRSGVREFFFFFKSTETACGWGGGQSGRGGRWWRRSSARTAVVILGPETFHATFEIFRAVF